MPRIRLALAVLVSASASLVVSLASPRPVPPPADASVIEPDARILELIKRTISISGRPQTEWEEAHFAGLRAMRTMPSEKLLPQLVYYAAKEAKKPGAEELAGIGAAVVFKVLLAEGHKYFSLISLLDNEDPRIREVAATYFQLASLSNYNIKLGGTHYYDMLGPVLHGKEEAPPRGLVRFLYTSPGAGMLTMLHQYLPEFSPESKAILWGEHVIADTLWRQYYGFLEKDRVDPAAAEQVDKLSRHDRWWVRLYVAALLRDYPVFRNKALIDRLERDANEIVKQTVKDFLNNREEPGP